MKRRKYGRVASLAHILKHSSQTLSTRGGLSSQRLLNALTGHLEHNHEKCQVSPCLSARYSIGVHREAAQTLCNRPANRLSAQDLYRVRVYETPIQTHWQLAPAEATVSDTEKKNGDDDDKHQYYQKIINLEFSPTWEAKVKARAIPRYRGRKSYAFHRRMKDLTGAQLKTSVKGVW